MNNQCACSQTVSRWSCYNICTWSQHLFSWQNILGPFTMLLSVSWEIHAKWSPSFYIYTWIFEKDSFNDNSPYRCIFTLKLTPYIYIYIYTCNNVLLEQSFSILFVHALNLLCTVTIDAFTDQILCDVVPIHELKGQVQAVYSTG